MRRAATVLAVVGLAVTGGALVDQAAASPLEPELERRIRVVGWAAFNRLPDCGHPAIRTARRVGVHPRELAGQGWVRMRVSRERCRVTFERRWLRDAVTQPVALCAAFAHASGHLLGYDHDDGLVGVEIMARLFPLDWPLCVAGVGTYEPGLYR